MKQRPTDKNIVLHQKRKAERLGRWAELWVAFVLILTGYRLKARRFRCPFGEIDLIVFKNNTIHFIEVKFRHNHTDTMAALPSFRSKKRLYKSSQYYMSQLDKGGAFDQNFHIVIVTKSMRLHWFDNVFYDLD